MNVNLKGMEKRSASAIFETGLVEITIGMIMMVSSLAMLFDDYRYYIDILYLAPVFFMLWAVKRIAEPRMGVVHLAKKRVRKNRILFIAITSFLVITVGLQVFGLNITGQSLTDVINPRIEISAIILFICFAVAYAMDFTRMYIYGIIIVAAFNWSEEIRESPLLFTRGAYAYLVAALILGLTGCIYLTSFLKRNPLPQEDMNYDE